MVPRAAAAFVCVTASALALAGLARARTVVVYAGPPPTFTRFIRRYLPPTFTRTYRLDADAFFNRRTTVSAGDTVSFRFRGFHTVDLPGWSNTDLPFIVPGATASGESDAAGNPFWFDGRVPLLSVNIALFTRDTASQYDGSSRIDSGLLSSKPFNVQFTRPGTYRFFCDVHAHMFGFVVVRPRGAAIPSSTQQAVASRAQQTADVRGALRASKLRPRRDTVSLGQATAGGDELYAMFPRTLTVTRGTTVDFTMPANSQEIHTASFGPLPYLSPLTRIFPSPDWPPAATFPSDPGQPLHLGPRTHGNGFTNTGILDRDPATPFFPTSRRIDFTTAGVYHYQCLVHPYMRGTIIVR